MKREKIMIIRKFLVVCVLVLGLFGNAIADLNNGLVAHYEFNGNTNDSSGNENHATVNGNLTYSKGRNSDDAIYFNNPPGFSLATQYIKIPYTISIKNIETTSFSIHLCYKTNDANQQNGRLFGNGSITRKGVIMDYNSGAQSWAYSAVEDINGNSFIVAIDNPNNTNPIVTDGYFHCEALILNRNSNTLSQFIDGILVGSVITNIGNVPMDSLVLGAAAINDRYGARDTSVDDLRIYNRALSSAEIQELYTKNSIPSSSSCTSPQAITVSENLDIQIPSLNYTSLLGTQNLWVNLKYYGKGPNGEILWKLKDFGINP